MNIEVEDTPPILVQLNDHASKLEDKIRVNNADLYWIRQDIKQTERRLRIATHSFCFFLGALMCSLLYLWLDL
jgi:hypothetical protein